MVNLLLFSFVQTKTVAGCVFDDTLVGEVVVIYSIRGMDILAGETTL